MLADDEALLVEGLARLLAEAGVEVVGKAATAPETLRCGRRLPWPDVAVIDIRMPPGHADDGRGVAAQEIRRRHADVGVLVLSHHLESRYAMRLLEEAPERAGYLLKERVSDVAVLVDALQRIVDGECVVDPTIVARLMCARRAQRPLQQLTAREREVLALMAEGRSNQAICGALFLSPKTVEGHVRQIFMELDCGVGAQQHRRVQVLAFLRSPQN